MATLRSLLVVVLAFTAAQPTLRVEHRSRCSVLLVDVSPSMSDESLERAERWAHEYESSLSPGDKVVRVAFDGQARVIGGAFHLARTKANPTSASDYGRALDAAGGLCRLDQNRLVVLFGDGLDTSGDMIPAAERLRRLGFAIDVQSSRAPPPFDVAVRRVAPPSRVELGRPFRVGVDLYATRPTSATLRFELDGTKNPREASREVGIAAGDTHLEFESVGHRAGTSRLVVGIETPSGDTITENDRVTAAFEVEGPPRVLYVEGRPERAVAFASALRAQQFDVEVTQPTGFARSLPSLNDVAVIVLSDVQRSQLAPQAERTIIDYVRDGGGTLLFAGGSSSYAAGGWSGSALERILPVTVSSTEQQSTPDVALVLVIDRSGSMSGLPLQMAKAACAATVETLRTSDLVEVIAFDAKPTRYVTMQPARARAAIANDLSRMLSGGDTEMFPALDMAYQDLLAVEARRKHVILLTDGQSPKAGLSEIAQNMLAESITLTIVGLGSEVDDELLRHLAGRGGGRYHAAPDPNSLPRIFTREAESVLRSTDTSSRFDVVVRKRLEFMKGIDLERLPPLRGYARTRLKGSAELVLESDRGEPVLARQRNGSGWALGWTPDLRGEWAPDWVRWSDYGRFFAQLLRQHQARRVNGEVPLAISLEGDRLRLSADASNEAGFDNDRAIAVAIEGPDAASSTELTCDLVAPGAYRASWRLPKVGEYRLHAIHRRFDEAGLLHLLGESHGHVALPYPVEYQRLEPDLQALEQLVQVTRGRLDPPVDVVRQTTRHAIAAREPWHVPWLLTALGIFIADLALKRLRFRR